MCDLFRQQFEANVIGLLDELCLKINEVNQRKLEKEGNDV
jgi:hypothetical protein